MWEELDTKIEKRPGPGGCIAASFRQLLRARDASDQVACWLATSSFSTWLRLLLRGLLAEEPSWDAKERWIEGLSDHKILFEYPVSVRVPGAMVWYCRDVRMPTAEPFEAELEFTSDYSDLASYSIRFGDRRAFPD
ncbi:MAG TPA: hypothetical protein VG269_26545, partial [Tepidisphaeraceae bacterium]|nr:hypothetical protein [Tepidisphaeraceae bacterium]